MKASVNIILSQQGELFCLSLSGDASYVPLDFKTEQTHMMPTGFKRLNVVMENGWQLLYIPTPEPPANALSQIVNGLTAWLRAFRRPPAQP